MKKVQIVALVLILLALNSSCDEEEESKKRGCPMNGDECQTFCQSMGRGGGYCGGRARQFCFCLTDSK
ncbi:unnamed protein product [Allacma fusca]|uniref:Invertebrate defensins family profile domain-containing protein n=1 Tax=Allacma fusca TaxID=39272 RepID=A0A8J2JM58_9HEXA|nr:unnamed protein product [Allacma fusca]